MHVHALLVTLLTLGAAGCGSFAGDGDVLFVRISDTQPDDPDHGRLLSVFAAAGDDVETRLQVTASAGQLRDPIDFASSEPICVGIAANQLLEQRIAVQPTDDEALVIAVLRDAGEGCSGGVREQIIVPIQRVGDDAGSADAALPDAPAPDAATFDASIDAVTP
jgi:hypothetical protein